MPGHHLVVVPHTHWDREWHLSFETFRARLVPILDGLLARLERDPSFRHFMLDGQTIVVDDYCAVRPEARERIAKLVRDGRLLVGPWTVLPDEWLVSGEALVRNLRLGLRAAEQLGGAMELGYVPDQFGHVGQLPQLFAGFGFEAAVLWRGVGGAVAETLFDWEAPDGTRLPTVWLPFGYGNAAQLPGDAEFLVERLRFEVARLAQLSRVSTLLLMNGSDHLPPQDGLVPLLDAATERLGELSYEIGTLPGFVARALAEVPGELPLHRGELRSGRSAPLLAGCASARMEQKRRDFALDSTLTRHVEPLAAALSLLGEEPDRGSLEHLWRKLLENHPHDSICGCSVDAVHEQIDARLAALEDAVTAQCERTAAALFARVAAPAAAAGAPGTPLVVWNPNAAGPTAVEAELELDLPPQQGDLPSVWLRAADGRALPARAELLDPGGETFSVTMVPQAVSWFLPALGHEFAGGFVRDVAFERDGARLAIDVRLASLPSGFDPEAARREILARIRAEELEELVLRARKLPRVRLRFSDALPGYGLRSYRVVAGTPGPAPEPPGELESGEEAGTLFARNHHWRIAVDPEGRVTLRHLESGLEISDALRIVSEGDRGDEYSFDAVPDGERVGRPERVQARLLPADAAEVGIEIEAHYAVPRALISDRKARSSSRVALPVRMRLRLRGALDRVDLDVALENDARDHRLRLELAAPFAARRFLVESAFETADRPIAPEPDAFGEEPSEFPCGAVPLRGFASLEGETHALSVATRGGEVEALPEAGERSALAFTLLRAVGWLSRGDLRARPGDAGPPLETPAAQVPGAHALAFSLRLHRADAPGRASEAHRFVHPPLARVGGSGPDAPLADGSRLVELDDPELVVSALEPSAGGGAVLRVYEAGGGPRRARLGLPLSDGASARAVDLRGRPAAEPELHAAAAGVEFALRAAQIVSIRLD